MARKSTVAFDNRIFDASGKEIGVRGCRAVGNNDIVLVRLRQGFTDKNPLFAGVEPLQAVADAQEPEVFELLPNAVDLEELHWSYVDQAHNILGVLSGWLGVNLACVARVYRPLKHRRGELGYRDAYSFELWVNGQLAVCTGRALEAVYAAVVRYSRRKEPRLLALNYPHRRPDDAAWPEDEPRIVENVGVSREGGLSFLCADPFGRGEFRAPASMVDWWDTMTLVDSPSHSELAWQELEKVEVRPRAELAAFRAFIDRNDADLDDLPEEWERNIQVRMERASA